MLLAGLLIGFMLGGVVGQLMLATRGPLALGYPAGATFAGGVTYVIWRTRTG